MCQQALSAFDLAIGNPTMSVILNPWKRPQGDVAIDEESQVRSILQFISRTARVTAHKIEQGADAVIGSDDAFTLQVSSIYFDTLTDAISSLIRTHESSLLVPECAGLKRLLGSCPHNNPRDNFTAVPIKRVKILNEYWTLLSESDIELVCDFCCAALAADYYICSICEGHSCADCQHAISVLSLEERFQDFRRLDLLRYEVMAVLQVLRSIRHDGPRAMMRIISQGPCLRNWVLQKDQDYRRWRSSRKVYSHFHHDNLLGWHAIDTMRCILSLSNGPSQDAGETVGLDAEETDFADGNWDVIAKQWHDIFAFNSLTEDFSDVCGHQCHMYLKKPRLTVDAALDSSGKLTAEFFEFLAEKYEAATHVGEIMDFLESERFDGGGGADVSTQDLAQTIPVRKDSARPWEDAKGGRSTDPIDYSSEDSSPDHSSSEPSEVGDPESLESGVMTADDLEDFLDSLLAKRNSLVKDGRLSEEEDLILNTAWNMAQAMVYQGTPRPSLKEILDNGEGYWTAPTTPLPSDGAVDGDSASSSYGTPRSMSSVSGLIGLGA